MPILSVSKTTAVPGTTITVSGQNFSGCAAQGNPHQPTPILTVKVGVITAAKVTEVLATTRTTATGSFSVQITVPTVPSGGLDKIALAAEAMDPVTGLTYEGLAAISYPVTPPTTSTPTTPQSTTSAATPQSSSTSVDIPTAVPAGTGGLAAPTSSDTVAVELGLGATGLLLAGFGGLGLARRRQQH